MGVIMKENTQARPVMYILKKKNSQDMQRKNVIA